MVVALIARHLQRCSSFGTAQASALPVRGEHEARSAAEPVPVRANEIGSPCLVWCSAKHATRDRTIHASITGNLPQEIQIRLVCR
jgi:hypothetical protein